MTEILYASEDEQVKRYSSIDQFKEYVHTTKQGGSCPIIFDQLDGIGECGGIKSHPVAITFGESDYIYPEGRCTYVSDHFIYVDKEGVEHRLLPECQGGLGEFYDVFVKSNSFVNFDDDSSLGLHNETTLRVGLDYVKASETLPPAD